MVARPALTPYEERIEPRDETLHRVRLVTADGAAHLPLIVNLSPNGFMIRTEHDVAVGERVTITLPVVGDVSADVRWTLGGRVGCKLVQEVPPALYQFVLAALR